MNFERVMNPGETPPIYARFMPVEYTRFTGRLGMTFAHGMKTPTRLLSEWFERPYSIIVWLTCCPSIDRASHKRAKRDYGHNPWSRRNTKQEPAK